MASSPLVSPAVWVDCHIRLPRNFRPFKFHDDWIPPPNTFGSILPEGQGDVTEILLNSFRQRECLFLNILNHIRYQVNENNLTLESARDCAAYTLQSMLYCQEKNAPISQQCLFEILSFRAKMNERLNDTSTALKDLSFAKRVHPTSPVPWLSSGGIFQKRGEWDKCYQEIINLLATEHIQWDTQHHSFLLAILLLSSSCINFTDVKSIRYYLSGQEVYWVDSPDFWKKVVNVFCEQQLFDNIGVITIGTCDKLIGVETPNHLIFKAAVISGIKYDTLNIGEMLYHLNAKGIKKWHLKMAEFFIQRDANVRTIASEFKRPLIFTMTMLSYYADAPSFLDLVWDKLSPDEFDDCDELEGTAYHFLARQTAKETNKSKTKTAEILCSYLLSKGCVTHLKDREGKLPHELISTTFTLHKMMKEWAELMEGVERVVSVCTLKDEDVIGFMEVISVIDDWREAVMQLHQKFPAWLSCLTMQLLKVSIVWFKKGDFLKSHQFASQSFEIQGVLGEIKAKTYYWIAVSAEKLENWNRAFALYLDGYAKQEESKDQTNMLYQCLNLVPKLAEDNSNGIAGGCLSCISSQPEETWTRIINIINEKKMWTVLKIFYLGPPFTNNDGEKGVLWCCPTGKINLRSIWDFIDDRNVQAPRLILALLHNGTDFTTLSSDAKEAVHAVVRFSALTNDTGVLNYVLRKLKQGMINNTDVSGRTPLHNLCQMKNKRVKDETLKNITSILCRAGCNTALKDNDGKLASDYASAQLKEVLKAFHGSGGLEKVKRTVPALGDAKEVKKLVQASGDYTEVKKTMPASASKVTGSDQSAHTGQLKLEGNEKFKEGNHLTALKLYQQAIDQIGHNVTDDATNHNKGIIFGNMAECHIKMNKWNDAFEFAKKSQRASPSWFKAHLRLGRIQLHLGYTNTGFQSLIESFKLIKTVKGDYEKYKKTVLYEFLTEELELSKALNEPVLNDPDMWAIMVCHCIDFEKNWPKSVRARCMIQGPLIKMHEVDLSIFCRLDKIEQYGLFVMEMLILYYQAKVDFSSLKFDTGDTVIHAMIFIMVFGAKRIELIQFTLIDILIDFTLVVDDCDDAGNTPLHLLALLPKSTILTSNETYRMLIAENLLDNHCYNVMTKNKKGELAIDLCHASDPLRELLLNEMVRCKGITGKQMQKMLQVSDNKKLGQSKKKGDHECSTCEDLMKKASHLQGEGEYSQMYRFLVTIINEKDHTSEKHEPLRQNCVNRIATALGLSPNPEIPATLTNVCADGMIDITKALIEKKKWTPLQAFITDMKQSKPRYNYGFLHKNLTVNHVVSIKELCGTEEERCQLLKFLFDNRAPFKPTSLDFVKNAMKLKEFKVVMMLLEKGADPKGITFTGRDTPLHAALYIALDYDKGNFAVFDWLNKKWPTFDWSCCDEDGNTLLHVAAKVGYSPSALKATQMLCKKHLPTEKKNKDGKLAMDFLSDRCDRRMAFLRLTKGKQKQFIDQKKQVDNENRSQALPVEKKTVSKSAQQKAESKNAPRNIFSKAKCQKEMVKVLSGLPDVPIDLFSKPGDAIGTDDESEDEEENEEDENEEDENEDQENKDGKSETKGGETSLFNVDISWCKKGAEMSDNEDSGIERKEEQDKVKDEIIDASVFDGTSWEVECTEEVWNLLKKQQKSKRESSKNKKTQDRQKELSDFLKRKFVMEMRSLAEGDWTRAKLVDMGQQSPELYQICLDSGSYIMFEIAVAFSPKRTNSDEAGNDSNHIYSEIIRVWNIILTPSEARQTLQKIIASHRRGKKCFVKETLECQEFQQNHDTATDLRCPVLYIQTEGSKALDPTNTGKNIITFHPAASTGKMEFHILKFYSFSSTLVSAIFNNDDIKVDFPFKVTPLEHSIISLPSASPILLLGRSGTGKTTICVYRLWDNFVHYWNNAQHQLTTDEAGTENDQVDDSLEGAVCSPAFDKESKPKGTVEYAEDQLSGLVFDNPWMVGEGSDNNDDDDEDDDYNDSGENDDNDKQEKEEDGAESRDEMQLQNHDSHLHQVLVTKNPQLCSEVGKTFQKLRNSLQFPNKTERNGLPNTLQELKDDDFPLFVTSRQLLLLLDASLPGKSFFQRDENMALEVEIPGWGTQEEIFHNVPLIESSDEDISDLDEKRESGAVGGKEIKGSRRRRVQDPRAATRRSIYHSRRECTYHVFANEVWRKIASKKMKEYHSSLVWTEIMSIIKGSYEALHSVNGLLTLDEYLTVGLKRAPNFSSQDRKEVYFIFEKYLKFKRENGLFDEADFVFDIFSRHKESTNYHWVFHEIYVDELQDFTQSELALLISVSHQPNKMFLSGDTAQSIMHGVSFRFEDVKSLFYFAKKYQKKQNRTVRPIKEPDTVHHLKYNYRSHAGILSLASSVLDLLSKFFPESYDIMERDQGLFDGPKPVIIKSCSPTDLSLLLSGNQRMTSHIEFGAHQAILVTNQEAKENIPADLRTAIVLTIYESKGLEFDDVLIYNFFKDSQASDINEWRVVTEYLNTMAKQGLHHDFNEDLFNQPGRPHPLVFKPSQHKILNTELKHLYTAITRARVNVWIFDENEDRSAPIFDYFRVLELVKTVGMDDKQEDVGEQIFPKKSSPKEWKTKGKMYMKNKLYESAAKCFSWAQDKKREQYAFAHLLAQKASLDNQQSMFLEAGSLFVQCGHLKQAAQCFQNSKERLLAAFAYEKCGQMERAAGQYRRLGKLIDASGCLERAGFFEQAISILVEAKNFGRALDCVNRYNNIRHKCKLESKPLPKVMIDHRPKDSHSEKHILFKIAEDHLNKNHEEMMFETIEQLEDPEDQYNFLLDKGYTRKAVKILDKMGRTMEAANFLFEQGDFEEGLEYAKKGDYTTIEASIHLTMGRMQLHGLEAPVSPLSDEQNAEKIDKQSEQNVEKIDKLKQQCEQNAQRALDLFKSVGDENGKGQARLLLTRLQTNFDMSLLHKAYRNFQKVKPVNEVGIMEVGQELFKRFKSGEPELTSCVRMMNMIRNGTQMMKILKNPTKEEADKHFAYLSFYGLELIPRTQTVSWNPKNYPLCLKRLSSLSDGQEDGKVQAIKTQAVEQLLRNLVGDLTVWAVEVWHKLETLCQKNPDKVLDILCLKVELDRMVQLKQSYFNTIDVPVEMLRWQSVESLLDFLPPISKSNSVQTVVNKIHSSEAVKSELSRYLLYKWDHPDRVEKGISNHVIKERAKESDWLIRSCLYDSLFGLNINVRKKAEDLEIELLELGKDWLRKPKKYAILTVYDNEQGLIKAVQSLGGRFIESFQFLVGSEELPPDPHEALYKFARLMEAFAYREKPSMMPKLDHLLFWLEFYCSLTFCFVGKARQDKDDTQFYLPSSYLDHFEVINACRGHHPGSAMIDIIKFKFSHRYNLEKRVLDRQDSLVKFLSGNFKFSNFNLLEHVPGLCVDEPLLAERIVILTLVLLLNTRENYVKVENHTNIVRALKEIDIEIKSCGIASTPLTNLLSSVSKINNYDLLHHHLTQFLQDCRGETLACCHWYDKAAPPLQTNSPTDKSSQNESVFFPASPKSPTGEKGGDDDGGKGKVLEAYEEADEIERQELERLSAQRQAQVEMEKKEKNKQKKAVKTIVRFLRQSVLKRMKAETGPGYQYEERQLFAPYTLSNNSCGICGVGLVDGQTVQGETKEIHERSDKHQTNVERLKEFRQQYRTKILRSLLDICIFMKTYQVDNHSNIYPSIALDVKVLLDNLSAFHTNLNNIMVKREWNNGFRMTISFNVLERSYQKFCHMIKRTYEDFQESNFASKRKISDEYEEETTEDFVHGTAQKLDADTGVDSDNHYRRVYSHGRQRRGQGRGRGRGRGSGPRNRGQNRR